MPKRHPYNRANSIVHFFLAFLLFGTPGLVMVILTLLNDPRESWHITFPILGAGLVVSFAAAWFKERFWRFLRALSSRRTLLDHLYDD